MTVFLRIWQKFGRQWRNKVWTADFQAVRREIQLSANRLHLSDVEAADGLAVMNENPVVQRGDQNMDDHQDPDLDPSSSDDDMDERKEDDPNVALVQVD
jgi:hypothetical protein